MTIMSSMASRYPRKRAEVDRKKRRAADTTHFLLTISTSCFLSEEADFGMN
jgi:hypothetical protein